MQEAYVCFLKCVRKYKKVTEPRHFMALFKVTLDHRFASLSNGVTRDRVVSLFIDITADESETVEFIDSGDDGVAMVNLLTSLPKEAVDALQTIVNLPVEFVTLACSAFQRTHDRRDAQGSFWRGLVGPGVDELYDALKEARSGV